MTEPISGLERLLPSSWRHCVFNRRLWSRSLSRVQERVGLPPHRRAAGQLPGRHSRQQDRSRGSRFRGRVTASLRPLRTDHRQGECPEVGAPRKTARTFHVLCSEAAGIRRRLPLDCAVSWIISDDGKGPFIVNDVTSFSEARFCRFPWWEINFLTFSAMNDVKEVGYDQIIEKRFGFSISQISFLLQTEVRTKCPTFATFVSAINISFG